MISKNPGPWGGALPKLMRVLLGSPFIVEAYELPRLSRTGRRKNEPWFAERRRRKPRECEKTNLNAHVHWNPLHVIISKTGNTIPTSNNGLGQWPSVSAPELRAATLLNASIDWRFQTHNVGNQHASARLLGWGPNPWWSCARQGRFESLIIFMEIVSSSTSAIKGGAWHGWELRYKGVSLLILLQ